MATLPIRKALVYGRDAEKSRAFAEKMSALYRIEVEPIGHPRRAVEYQPLVITATSSKDPVFEGQWLTPGTLVCAMGSNWLHKAEVDADAVAAAKLVVCDSVAACQAEAGDFVQALAQGRFKWQEAAELSDIVANQRPARKSEDDIILFKSVGLGIEDVALAAKALELAAAKNMGQRLSL
jgi:ornithine cyclodeaminase/alanine dehydrogenase-like protein (mu-crystallin family)